MVFCGSIGAPPTIGISLSPAATELEDASWALAAGRKAKAAPARQVAKAKRRNKVVCMIGFPFRFGLAIERQGTHRTGRTGPIQSYGRQGNGFR